MPVLRVGDVAPLFSLLDQNGKPFHLAEHLGKQKILLYFYPKNESLVCTIDVCDFRDHFTQYTQAGALVVGINYDSTESHKAFAKNHNLPFTLLSDPDKKILQLYGVKNSIFSSGRQTFIIGTNGKIIYTHRSQFWPKRHTQKALRFLNKI